MGKKIDPDSEKWADKPKPTLKDIYERELVKKRHSCTDIICLILFLIFGLVQAALSILIFANGGDPRNILLPHDSNGNICQGSKPNLFYFNLAACLSVSALVTSCNTPSICVASCPTNNLFYMIDSQRSTLYTSYCTTDNSNAASIPSALSYTNLVQNQSCPGYALSSKALYYRCLPSFIFSLANGFIGNSSSLTANDTTTGTSYNISDLTSGTAITDKTIYQASQYITSLLNIQSIGNLLITQFNAYLTKISIKESIFDARDPRFDPHYIRAFGLEGVWRLTIVISRFVSVE